MATILCGGTDLQACKTTNKLWDMNKSNWAVEGWNITNPGTGSANRAFDIDGCSGRVHHIAQINNVAFNVASGYHADDCGTSGAFGVDYWAVVGNIAQNAAQNNAFCEAAIDAVAMSPIDTNAGTHIFINGNASYANTSTGCSSDTEDYMADTWDFHNFGNQGVFSNNIGYGATRNCVQIFEQSNSTPNPAIKIYNNTCYDDLVNVGTDNTNGEIRLASSATNISYVVTVQNNLSQQTNATSNGHPVYAYEIDNATGSGGSVTTSGNYFLGAATSCPATCNSGSSPFSAITWHGVSLGTNTYSSPSFTNTTDLLTNQVGTPNCTGFENVTQCLGWNAVTSTLTTPSIISDLVPTTGGTSTKGYQQPSTVCAANADYPTWLKGIVYLHWNGTSLTQNAGLVSRPCGL